MLFCVWFLVKQGKRAKFPLVIKHRNGGYSCGTSGRLHPKTGTKWSFFAVGRELFENDKVHQVCVALSSSDH
jgi:hypothetical protein